MLVLNQSGSKVLNNSLFCKSWSKISLEFLQETASFKTKLSLSQCNVLSQSGEVMSLGDSAVLKKNIITSLSKYLIPKRRSKTEAFYMRTQNILN